MPLPPARSPPGLPSPSPGPAPAPAGQAASVRCSGVIPPAHRIGLSLGTCACIIGTRPRGTPRFSLDGLLIPEGTSHDHSPVRRDGPGGAEHPEPRPLPAGTVRATVPRHRRNRGDLLPLH